jgi:hypothetical protein
MIKNKILLTAIAGELATVALLISGISTYSTLASISSLLSIAIPSLALATIFMIVNNMIDNIYKKYSRKNTDTERRLVSTIFTKTQVFTIFILMQVPASALFGKIPVILALVTILIALTFNIKHPLIKSKNLQAEVAASENLRSNADIACAKVPQSPTRIIGNRRKPLLINTNESLEKIEPTSSTDMQKVMPSPIKTTTTQEHNNTRNEPAEETTKSKPPTVTHKKTDTYTTHTRNSYFKNFREILVFIVSIATAISTLNILSQTASRILGVKKTKTLINMEIGRSDRTEKRKRKKFTEGYILDNSLMQMPLCLPTVPLSASEITTGLPSHFRHSKKAQSNICLSPLQPIQLLNQSSNVIEDSDFTSLVKIPRKKTKNDGYTQRAENDQTSYLSSAYTTYTLTAFVVYSAIATTQRPRPF